MKKPNRTNICEPTTRWEKKSFQAIRCVAKHVWGFSFVEIFPMCLCIVSFTLIENTFFALLISCRLFFVAASGGRDENRRRKKHRKTARRGKLILIWFSVLASLVKRQKILFSFAFDTIFLLSLGNAGEWERKKNYDFYLKKEKITSEITYYKLEFFGCCLSSLKTFAAYWQSTYTGIHHCIHSLEYSPRCRVHAFGSERSQRHWYR